MYLDKIEVTNIFPNLKDLINKSIDIINFSKGRIEDIQNKNIYSTDLQDILFLLNNLISTIIPNKILPKDAGRVELEWLFDNYKLRIEIVPKRERYNYSIIPKYNSNIIAKKGCINNINELTTFIFKHIMGIEFIETFERNNNIKVKVMKSDSLPLL